MGNHIVENEFQSDKYPTCPRGKVPLSVEDPTAQDLLWIYAQRRRSVDAEFSEDLEACLKTKGFRPDPSKAAIHAAAPLVLSTGERENLRAVRRLVAATAKSCSPSHREGYLGQLALLDRLLEISPGTPPPVS